MFHAFGQLPVSHIGPLRRAWPPSGGSGRGRPLRIRQPPPAPLPSAGRRRPPPTRRWVRRSPFRPGRWPCRWPSPDEVAARVVVCGEAVVTTRHRPAGPADHADDPGVPGMATPRAGRRRGHLRGAGDTRGWASSAGASPADSTGGLRLLDLWRRGGRRGRGRCGCRRGGNRNGADAGGASWNPVRPVGASGGNADRTEHHLGCDVGGCERPRGRASSGGGRDDRG